MKKLILLIVILILYTSCTQSFRDNDTFIIVSKYEKAGQKYKYEYKINHYTQNMYLNDTYIYKSNISYEIYDTITFGSYKCKNKLTYE
jgi:hypothetical protein